MECMQWTGVEYVDTQSVKAADINTDVMTCALIIIIIIMQHRVLTISQPGNHLMSQSQLPVV